MANFAGTGGDDSLLGTAGDDDFHLELGGDDTAIGADGADTFYLGDAFTYQDHIDGGRGFDRLVLDGDYSAGVELHPATLRNIDEIDFTAGHSYGLSNLNYMRGPLVLDASALGVSDTVDLDARNRTGAMTLLGGAGADSIDAGTGADSLQGGSGDDVIYGGGGANTIEGGDGNDHINGGLGSVRLAGDGGNDFIEVSAVGAVVLGGDGDDGIFFIGRDCTVFGGRGDDVISPHKGFDGTSTGALFGGVGDDWIDIEGGTGGWTAYGGSGDDLMIVRTDLSHLHGDDLLDGEKGDDTMLGADGHDTLSGGQGRDLFYGSAGGFHGHPAGQELAQGGAGRDTFIPERGADTFDGGTGDDVLDASGYKWAVVDLQAGTGFGGNFGHISLASVEDVLGGTRSDRIAGDDQANRLEGLGGADTLSGAGGDDRLIGGAKADVLTGGLGADVLDGGAGADAYVFGQVADSSGAATDLILKLQAHDVIDLSAIDADATADGDQAFVLVSALSGHAGELALTYDAGLGRTLLEGDVDGDGVADLEIAIKGDHADFTAFVL